MQTSRDTEGNAGAERSKAEARRDPNGNPIGEPLPNWSPRQPPPRTPMEGRACLLEPVDPGRHLADLWRAVSADPSGAMWTYLAYGPFASMAEYGEWIRASCLDDDPLFFTVIERGSGRASGLASYLRIAPAVGTIEIGHLQFSPRLQRTTVATEAMFLMLRRVFSELGYRRCEWKCDQLNEPSRRAAERLGFRFEGVFRQATVYKGRNRDTAWYAMLDTEWPALETAFAAWLDPRNFDEQGRQRRSLESWRAPSAGRRGLATEAGGG